MLQRVRVKTSHNKVNSQITFLLLFFYYGFCFYVLWFLQCHNNTANSKLALFSNLIPTSAIHTFTLPSIAACKNHSNVMFVFSCVIVVTVNCDARLLFQRLIVFAAADGAWIHLLRVSSNTINNYSLWRFCGNNRQFIHLKTDEFNSNSNILFIFV